VATTADGKEAYRHPASAPVPKDLQEASSYLGSAALNYQRDPTPGNKTALTLAQTQHDLMYKDKVVEASQQAKQTAIAQGKDYEAMVRTGKNPISLPARRINNLHGVRPIATKCYQVQRGLGVGCGTQQPVALGRVRWWAQNWAQSRGVTVDRQASALGGGNL
jgi:hypothetical protein